MGKDTITVTGGWIDDYRNLNAFDQLGYLDLVPFPINENVIQGTSIRVRLTVQKVAKIGKTDAAVYGEFNQSPYHADKHLLNIGATSKFK